VLEPCRLVFVLSVGEWSLSSMLGLIDSLVGYVFFVFFGLVVGRLLSGFCFCVDDINYISYLFCLCLIRFGIISWFLR